MRFTTIALTNYRNIEFARLAVDAPRVFFYGRNGQGKTNMLEAIGLSTTLRAFRAKENEILIGSKSEYSEILYEAIQDNSDELNAKVRIKRRGKEVSAEGSMVKRASEFVGRMPTVVLSSGDLSIARGSPSIRRRYLDTFLCGVDRSYFTALQRFQKALQERNALLKTGPEESLLSAFEAQLIEPAAELVKGRRAAMETLNELAQGFYARLSGEAEVISVEYQPNFDCDNGEAYVNQLSKSRGRDLMLQTTSKGPHRDDFRLLLNGRSAADFASDGQQRSIVLSLSFAMISYWRKEFRVAPVVLADDILGELDPERKKRFWEAMDSDLQVFATGTELPSEYEKNDWLLFEVSEGRFEQMS
ncbi:DNA replication and repair protein RecF [Puniceicoccaceae bacterium K14]|nr:DNA replication and repair protein RecF [Puniceicoccaceae bacterium K14]